MGTKNNPGAFDCYANAAPDEPMFVLLGRDRHAATLVRIWALLRHREGGDEAKVDEAIQCGRSMDGWRVAHGGKSVGEIDTSVGQLLIAATTGMSEHPDDYDHPCDCDECRSCG